MVRDGKKKRVGGDYVEQRPDMFLEGGYCCRRFAVANTEVPHGVQQSRNLETEDSASSGVCRTKTGVNGHQLKLFLSANGIVGGRCSALRESMEATCRSWELGAGRGISTRWPIDCYRLLGEGSVDATERFAIETIWSSMGPHLWVGLKCPPTANHHRYMTNS